jgi:hypothetical protein
MERKRRPARRAGSKGRSAEWRGWVVGSGEGEREEERFPPSRE